MALWGGQGLGGRNEVLGEDTGFLLSSCFSGWSVGTRGKLVQYQEVLGTAAHQLLKELGIQMAETPGSQTGNYRFNSG